jgi:hypothetical protein
MIMSKHTSIDPSDINRRQFLAAGTGLSFSLAMGSAMLPMGTSAQTNDARMAINVWVNIATDNTITILAPTAEMGQGTLTTLPLISIRIAMAHLPILAVKCNVLLASVIFSSVVVFSSPM